MSNRLGRVDFASKRKTVTVDVPELEGSFTLRALSLAQLRSLNEGDGADTARLLSLAIIDPDTGQRIYKTDEDLANLGEMSVSVMKILTDAAAGLHGQTAEAVADTVKN